MKKVCLLRLAELSGVARPCLAAIWLLAFLLTGCHNDPNPKPWREKRADGKPWVVRYASMPEEVRSLDPQVSYDSISRMVLEPVQDCLLEYAPMKIDPYELQPCLLESIPSRTMNADGTVDYLCKLKRGIFFHDDPCFPRGKGRELVAADVHFSIQRLCDPKVESPISANLAEYIAGMTEATDAAKRNGERFDYATMKVSGVEALDSHTFKLHLLKPYPQILYWMAMHFMAPVAQEAVNYYDGLPHADGSRGEMISRPLFRFHPVGTGPFKIVEWVRGQRFRFVRNENYRTTVFPSEGWPKERDAVNGPLAGHALPLVDEVQLGIFRELLPMWLLTRQGYLDRFAVQKDAFNSLISATKGLTPKYADRGLKLEKAVEVSTFYISFNQQDPVIGTNKKLRQALSCAYNPQGFIDILYGGVAPIAQQLLSPGVFGYQKDFRNPYAFNLEKGRRLIAEAGYPNGIDPATGQPLKITMDTTANSSAERQLAEYEQRQLEQLGIHVEVVENTFARMLEKEDQGNFQIAAGTGWGADYPDPENYFFLFASSNFPPTGKNINRYKNPEFDQLFEKMASMENSPERLEIARKLNEILIEDCPMVLNFHKAYFVVTQPWSPETQVNMMLEGGFKYMTVDPALREQKRREWNAVALWPIPVAIALVIAGLGYAVYINRRRNV
ncbi:MAG: ABC-type oligopeptide transport system,periplasmic component [Chthoniobacteraceae bacterium]|nr:ABC-type oligopeptide transport system,periplasmic component [Chthoniobacteraceae bacterium]